MLLGYIVEIEFPVGRRVDSNMHWDLYITYREVGRCSGTVDEEIIHKWKSNEYSGTYTKIIITLKCRTIPLMRMSGTLP